MTQPVDDFNPDAFHLSEEDEAAAQKKSDAFIDGQEVIVPSNKCESGACEI
jgi:hypothetical protein